MSEDAIMLARRGFDAWRRGDFVTLEALLDAGAEWRWWEPGEWDCFGRDAVLGRLRERYEQGFAQQDVELVAAGPDRVIAVSHPAAIGGEGWPEETATVITFRAGTVVALRDYPTRADAEAALAR
jgi:ketosteroid isomerase-like protein